MTSLMRRRGLASGSTAVGAVLRGLLLGGALLLAAGSGGPAPGERAATGECPAGEVCSEATPDGLYFRGADFSDLIFDRRVYPTAVGGTQTVAVDLEALASPISAFEARTSGVGLSVVQVSFPEVTVHASAAGTSDLRILEPGTGRLYDRLPHRTLEIDHLTLTPSCGALWNRCPEDENDPEPLFYADAPVGFVARLFGGGDRLVDESLRFEAEDETSVARVSTGGWDAAYFTASEDATSLRARVVAGNGAVARAHVALAREIDTLEPAPGMSLPRAVFTGDSVPVAFRGLLGGRPVEQLPISIRIIDPRGNDRGEITLPSYSDGWHLTLTMSLEGTWTVWANALGVHELYLIQAFGAPSPPPP